MSKRLRYARFHENVFIIIDIKSIRLVLNSYTIVCSPVREIIHSLKPVDYLYAQTDKPWYNYNLNNYMATSIFSSGVRYIAIFPPVFQRGPTYRIVYFI